MRPVRGRYRNLGPRTARRDKRVPCRATYSEMQSIFAPSTAARVGGVTRNAAIARVPNMAALLGIMLVWSIPRRRWAPTNPRSIAAAIEIRRASGVAGTNDCESPGQIAVTGKGWVIGGKEFVPFDEATPSPDGKIWICRRPDHTRRCVFGPPPARSATALRQDQTNFSKIS